MNKMKYLKLLNPVFLIVILLIPFVTGSLFHWSLLAAALVVIIINGIVIYSMAKDYEGLYRFSYFDSLTKIPNRLSTDLYCSRIGSIENLSVAVADLDNLKVMNDTHGHFAGDELIKNFATAFFTCAGEEGFAARNGGDEFIVFFHQESSEERLQRFCEILQKRIESYNESSPVEIKYSIGCAYGKSSSCRNIHELVSLADQLMYQQKKEKKMRQKKQKGCPEDER